MAETRGPSSPVNQVSSSGLVLHNDIVGMRGSRTPRRFSLSEPGNASDEISYSAIRNQGLREFCCRLLGWSDECVGLVDEVVHDLLTALGRGNPIALRGESDLVPIAYALHRRLLGPEYPFVVCDPRLHEREGSVRTPPSRRSASLALEAALGGSVCIRARRLAPDFDVFATRFREPAPTAVIFVCLHGADRVRDLLCRPLRIPTLAERASESDQLVRAALDDAAALLGVHRLHFSLRMREIVFEHITSFADLDKTALRLVALVSASNSSQAAVLLGMAPVSLIRWLRRRRWVVVILRDLDASRTGADNDPT